MNEERNESTITLGPRLTQAMLGGFVGTVAMTLLMYYLAPFMLGQPMDVATMLASAVGGTWMFGMTLHFIDGTLIFPAIYARGVYTLLPGSPAVRGTAWGVILWLVSEAFVMPALGAGFFSSRAGGFPAVVALLVAHLVYGVCLGAIAGERDAGNLGVHVAAEHHAEGSA